MENYLPGDLCSGLIICWRKIAGEMSPGEKFLGEKCDGFDKNFDDFAMLRVIERVAYNFKTLASL